MIIQPQNTGRVSNGQLSVDDLLAAAIAQGGAVGDAAQRIANPEKTLFQKITGATGSTLSGIINTLQTPLYAVNGMLDPDMSVADSIKNHVTPGDRLIQRPDKYDPFMDKVAYQAKKFALDTLLDPLTYVTFGAGRGVIGLTRGAEFTVGETLGKELLKKSGTRAYLSEAGEGLAQNYYKSKLNGLRQTFLKGERIKMVNRGLPEEEIVSRLAALEAEASDHLIKTTLNSTLDMKFATNAVANLLEKDPSKAKLLVDKGGIKFFGKSILEGQRIRAVKAMIPGMTHLDNAMLGVRGQLGNMFSTNYSAGVRLSDAYIDDVERWRHLTESKKGELAVHGARLKRQLKLTDNEWEFITAAVEHNLKPSDPRGIDIWNVLHGTPPANGTIREDVWKGMIEIKGMNKRMRRELLESGLPVSDFENYMPHLFVGEKISESPFKLTDRTKYAKISVLIDEQNNRIPTRLSGSPDKVGEVTGKMVVDGKTQEKAFKVVSAEKEVARIEKLAKENTAKINKSLEKLNKDIADSTVAVKTKLATKSADFIARKLKNTPDLSKEDITALAGAIGKYVDDNSVEFIVKSRMKNFYKGGVKSKGTITLSSGKTLEEADLENLALDIVMEKARSTDVADRINKLLNDGVKLPHQSVVKPTKKEVDEVAKIAREMRSTVKDIKKKVLERKVDSKGLSDVLNQMVAITSKNPAGIGKILDSIITNKQLAKDLTDELSDIARAVEIDKATALEQGGKYVTDTGRVYTRDRATIQEAKELGVDFEQNALVNSLIASDDAIRYAASRHMIKDVSKKFGRRESEAGEDWLPIEQFGPAPENVDLEDWMNMDRATKSILADNGERILFPPEVAKHITNLTRGLVKDDGTKAAFRAYDSLQNYFKAAVTSIFPAFHGRNALSNVFLMYNRIGMESLNPATHVAAANMINLEAKTARLQRKMIKGDADPKEYAEHMAKTVFTDKSGYRWSWGELRSQLHNNVVAFHHKNLGQTDQLKFGKSEVREAAEKMFPKTKMGKLNAKTAIVNPFSTENMMFQGGFKIGQKIEDYSRTLTFLSQLKSTGDPMQAARITRQALFDYTNLTNFEREVLRRIIPFYSFTRKNLELQVSTLLTNPGKIAQQIRATQTLGDSFSGEELTEKELAALPDWAKDGYALVRKREGSHITLLRTLGTPLEEFAGRANADSNLGMISPLLKAPFEMASGYSVFHGKAISEVTQADAYKTAPKAIKDFIGFEEINYTNSKTGESGTYYTSFMPERMWMINNLQPVGRIFSEINRIDKSPDQGARLTSLFFGFGTREFDLAREEQKRIKENQEELQKVLEQANIGFTFTRYVPNKDTNTVPAL